MPNRRPLAALILAGILALAGCSTGGDGDDPAQDSPESNVAGTTDVLDLPEIDVSDIPDVVAEVNGEEIGKEQFIATYEGQYQQLMFSQQDGDVDQDELKALVADQLVNNLLLVQAAEAKGITATDEDVEAALGELGAQNGFESLSEVFEAFAEQGISEELVRQDAAAQVRIDRFIEQEINVEEPSEEELKQQYDEFLELLEAQAGAMGSSDDEDMPSFEEVRELILDQSVEEQRLAQLQKLVDELLAEADVVIHL